MPLQQTSGNVTADAYGGGVAVVPTYIEDVFSTWLYTGNGSTQTINNGIDLAGKGGLTWIKDRTSATAHALQDTVRGANNFLNSQSTAANQNSPTANFAFTSSGFSQNNAFNSLNLSSDNYASWTFRKQPKFFDVVTYTGTGSPQTIAHNLGSVPGCIITKRTDTTGNWTTYHRSLGNTDFLNLNTIAAASADSGAWDNTTPTSTQFTVGSGNTNVSGGTYVAYVFAHDAGGFGLTGTDNVISCGSYAGNGALTGPVVNLGYEPQWLLIRSTGSSANWMMIDNMRGMVVDDVDSYLQAQSSAAEQSAALVSPTATGFQINGTDPNVNSGTRTYIYIAIRRGPMKVPTDATKVFSPTASSVASGTVITTNFRVDAQLGSDLVGTSNRVFVDRLRGISTNTTGAGQYLLTNSTAVEATDSGTSLFWDNTGFQMNANFGGASAVFWNFQRAPGFFDEVCYTGTGVLGRAVNHNLTVAPELIIVKERSEVRSWVVGTQFGVSSYVAAFLNLNQAAFTSEPYGGYFNSAPTSTQFFVTDAAITNGSGQTYVAYLFASCPGVSKVGSYTGNGTTQTINCGFTGGARFVLIKRTDSTGDWYVYDTARGMTTLTDPYLFLNSNAAQSATLGSVTTVTTGFAVNASVLAAINTNAASYIYLAIA